MKRVLSLSEIGDAERSRVGGKAWSLAAMARRGLNVPDAVCVSADVYREYLSSTGLGDRIALIIHRKRFEDMRWEEVWDASLRVRNLFVTTPIPERLRERIRAPLVAAFGEAPVAVRSSAPGEDSVRASFAGLHDSYLNLRGTDAILRHIVRVWASLWSDGALLYRQELGLRPEKSAMAVIVQKFIVGSPSGVAFGMDPNDPRHAVIEAVHGLNQGLVDGAVEPDRWILDRTTGHTLSHAAAARLQRVSASETGVEMVPLLGEAAGRPPLQEAQIRQVYELVKQAEESFGSPQDVEWTFHEGELHALQSRPITGAPVSSIGGSDDKRPWYLSLSRSLENLKRLRSKIEDELIPAMDREARRLAARRIDGLSDAALADEIAYRQSVYARWEDTYARDCIPFAHGVRYFGRFYNDTVEPGDPYEFLDLLGATGMEGVSRNRLLAKMAHELNKDPDLAESLRRGGANAVESFPDFQKYLRSFLDAFGDLSWAVEKCFPSEDAVVRLVIDMSRDPSRLKQERFVAEDLEGLRKRFLERFPGRERDRAEALLDLARASYRLRDDDNVHMGRIRARVLEAMEAGRERLRRRGLDARNDLTAEQIVRALQDPGFAPKTNARAESGTDDLQMEGFRVKARQIMGQPASAGLAQGRARVVEKRTHLFEFQAGEVLVCDAIEPNMTFVVPLAAAIVERRGGMLIHGAIIAREYGLPCVTGVPDATRVIHSGDSVTVDGYLGLVVIG